MLDLPAAFSAFPAIGDAIPIAIAIAGWAGMVMSPIVVSPTAVVAIMGSPVTTFMVVMFGVDTATQKRQAEQGDESAEKQGFSQ